MDTVDNAAALREGHELSTWPSMKITRAWDHFNELSGRVDMWNVSRVYRSPMKISEDGKHIELMAPRGLKPPVEEWALILGDALHNVRAALDGIVWEFAHLGETAPAKPTRVAFPITRDEASWKSAAKDLESVPHALLQRIEQVQPWNESETPVTDHWLSILARLNNDDKHRGAITAIPLQEGFELDGLGIMLGDPAGEGSFEFWGTEVDAEAGEDTLIARFGFGAEIKLASPLPSEAYVALGAAARVGELLIPAASLQFDLVPLVNRVLHYLRHGGWPNTSTFEPDTSGVPTGEA